MSEMKTQLRFQDMEKIAKVLLCRKINFRGLKIDAIFCIDFQDTKIELSAAKTLHAENVAPFERYIILIVSNGVAANLLRSLSYFGNLCKSLQACKYFANICILRISKGVGGSGRLFLSTR